MEDKIKHADAAAPAAPTPFINKEEQETKIVRPPTRKIYAFMRDLLRRHIAMLHEQLRSEIRELEASHAALMKQASPLFGETPASWLEDVDAWSAMFAHRWLGLRVVRTRIAQARREYRLVTQKYRDA